MDKELIVQQEAANDGQTIHLYYDDIVGMYVAYGLSAYYVDMVTSPVISYSDAIGIPVALLDRGKCSVSQTEPDEGGTYREIVL